tara:strand:+ start:176 stop:1480 length:1305 start_codon:yes stop_codon:yes gene_type:complete
MSTVKVYKDQGANSIFIEDANGAQFLNSLQAVDTSGKVTINDLAKQIEIVSNEVHTNFVDENDAPYTGTVTDVVNTLNSIFQTSGTPTTELPNITSPLTINSVQGSVINYELTADFGVGYEWDFTNVPGITTVNGNDRKIIGGSGLVSGTYNIPVKAINYNGEDSETIVLTVSTPPFANTKSVQFNQNDFLLGNGGIVQNVLGRASNGSGASDAWSIGFYFKAGTSNNQNQTIFYTGNANLANNNHIKLTWNGNNAVRQKMIFQYGSNNNNLRLDTPVGSVQSDGFWHHYLITYDGGTTGSSSGQINNYYSRFKIFIDGVQQTTTNSNSNFGITTGLVTSELQVAKLSSGGNTLRNNCKIDELALWDSDQSANISSIYNGGVPFNLNTLTDKPVHWSRMGDGDTYPNLTDSGTAGNLTWVMQFMTAADIVNDVP